MQGRGGSAAATHEPGPHADPASCGAGCQAAARASSGAAAGGACSSHVAGRGDERAGGPPAGSPTAGARRGRPPGAADGCLPRRVLLPLCLPRLYGGLPGPGGAPAAGCVHSRLATCLPACLPLACLPEGPASKSCTAATSLPPHCRARRRRVGAERSARAHLHRRGQQLPAAPGQLHIAGRRRRPRAARGGKSGSEGASRGWGACARTWRLDTQ